MPILERDPWREQYFAGVECPAELIIPTDDPDCYRLYPRERWIYNKLLICETQGLEHGPHGLIPPRFPVFSKPIYNLRGMGTGGRVLRSLRDYERGQRPGHLWMPLLLGEHVSTDYALLRGEPVWCRHTLGHPLPGGRFDFWEVQAPPRPALEAACGAWLRKNLPGYSGMVNLETIAGTIIEGHLRFSDQWPDLYGPGWVRHLVELYQGGRWTWREEAPRAGFSVVLFSPHGVAVQVPDPAQVEALRQHPGISSIQITFHSDREPGWHAMPPGGFRLAIVNCWDLAQGRQVRARLAELFGVQPPSAA